MGQDVNLYLRADAVWILTCREGSYHESSSRFEP